MRTTLDIIVRACSTVVVIALAGGGCGSSSDAAGAPAPSGDGGVGGDVTAPDDTAPDDATSDAPSDVGGSRDAGDDSAVSDGSAAETAADAGASDTDAAAASDIGNATDATDATDATSTDSASGTDSSSEAGGAALDAGAETVAASGCPGSPAPPHAVPGGSAIGDLLLRDRAFKWVSSALVPIPGTSFVQIVVSDDPALCTTLQSNHQSSTCSLSPGSAAPDVSSYSYLGASLAVPARATTGITELPFYSGLAPRIDAVGLVGDFVVNEAIADSTTELTGQFFVCSSGIPLSASGDFHATSCPGAKPICF